MFITNPKTAPSTLASHVMDPGMWHKVSDGSPVTDATLNQASYIVLRDSGNGDATFKLVMVKGDDVLETLETFQKTTGITSGRGQAVFNVEHIELDQWVDPASNNGSNHVPSMVKGSREGVLLANLRFNAPPHCHALVAGINAASGTTVVDGYPAVGGHLGAAKVRVVLEMDIDAFAEKIVTVPGGPLGGVVTGVSPEQQEAARKLTESQT